ncbi:MAG: STAS domain-containing protein [Candidatus Altimarinota bacterium]
MSDISITASEFVAGTQLVKFVGQLDETNIEDQAQKIYQIMEGDVKNLVFDFSELSYLNSKSIGYIADWQQKISQKGGKLVIVGAKENIFDILDVVGLANIIPIVDTEEDAKKAL